MRVDETASIDERRFVEIDAVLKRLNMKIAIVVAGAAVLFFGRFGAGFLVFAFLPMCGGSGGASCDCNGGSGCDDGTPG